MFILKPLRHPTIAVLWTSQVLAATGDEFFRIAVVWIAVAMVGSDAGYLSAAQFLASLSFSLAAGVIVDRWDRRRAIIGAEVARTAFALAVPLVVVVATLEIWHLYVVAVAVTGLRSLVLTGTLAALPALARAPEEQHALNGLLDGVRRLARIVGPGLVGVAAAVVAVPHLMTLAAAAFAISALTFAALPGRFGGARRVGATSPRRLVLQLVVTARAVARHPLISWSIAIMLFTSVAWTTVFTLGLVLHVQRTMPGDIGAYGAIIAAYGFGNVAMNIVVASVKIRRFGLIMFGGRLFYGTGIILIGLAPDIWTMMLAASLASFGGPMGDVPFLTLMQRDFPAGQHGRVYALRICADSAGLLIGAVIAAELLAALDVQQAILAAGAFATATALVGVWRFWRE